ncbi:MAG: hypothetical protein KDA96_07375 [Planctomycetaceae bacterium]|nr:hypothetical protein [Planctomycetaceae bacterium]
MRFGRVLVLLLAGCVALSPWMTVGAALPPEVRRELTELKKQATEISAMIRRKEVDEAKQKIEEIEKRIEELMIDPGERDRNYTGLVSTLERAKNSIPVSFEREVAPIVKASCLNCHGAGQASGNLRLDTYANMGRGGRSGALAIPRRPANSLILFRLMHTDDMVRMPRGRAKLSDSDVNVIARWIEQGAAFDGEDMNAPIGDSTVKKKPPVQVVMADGSESVSFTKDVAPWMVTICMGCHSGNNARAGFSMETFEQLLAGGETGNTIVPGKSDESYICDLVLKQDPIKMPAGQALLKRSQANALKTWIDEGARFDGTDSKAPLRSLVPTEAEMEAAKLAAMSEDEFNKRREDQAKEIWKRVSPRAEGNSVTTTNLLIHGNADEARLAEFANWGETQVKQLTDRYKLPAGEKPWRGRLIVFVGKERFDYEEFNTVLMNGRRTPRSVSGHVVINANFETAYVTMHDVGDEVPATELSSQQLLNSLIARAFVTRDGSALPDWLVQGFGVLESGIDTSGPYARAMPQEAGKALSTISDPATIFDNGTFAPEEVGAVGFLIVRFLINGQGNGKLQALIQQLRGSPNVGRALQQTYGFSAAELGRAFMQNGLR